MTEAVYISQDAINGALAPDIPRVSDGFYARYTPGDANATLDVHYSRGAYGTTTWLRTVKFPRGTESLEDEALAFYVKYLEDENKLVIKDNACNPILDSLNDAYRAYLTEVAASNGGWDAPDMEDPENPWYLEGSGGLLEKMRRIVAPIVETGEMELWKHLVEDIRSDPCLINKGLISSHMYISFARDVPDIRLVTITADSTVVVIDEANPDGESPSFEPELVPFVETIIDDVKYTASIDGDQEQQVRDYIASLSI